MFKNQKGITLIALVITIIVLLILAGVTIAMLTGSDSAPAKANEAKQKQDIGALKDQLYIYVSDFQTRAYEDVYVDGKVAGTTATGPSSKVTKGNASSSVGAYVGSELIKKSGAKSGNAEATISNAAISDVNPTSPYSPTNASDVKAYIRLKTTDFVLYGHIETAGGVLVWDGDIQSITH